MLLKGRTAAPLASDQTPIVPGRGILTARSLRPEVPEGTVAGVDGFHRLSFLIDASLVSGRLSPPKEGSLQWTRSLVAS